MEILGIGASELAFIIIIALLVLGPKDMQKAGKTVGKWLRDLITSDGWKVFQQTSREIRNLPTRLMREANEDLAKINKEINKEVNKTSDLLRGTLTTDGKIRSRPMTTQGEPPASIPSPDLPPSKETENSVLPPSVNADTPPVAGGEPGTGDNAESGPNHHD
jgi:sec-independent protein translocase protein TatB